MVKAVIFDMDGTAIDSMMSGPSSVKALLKQLNLETDTKEAQDLMAKGWHVTAQMINEVYNTDFCEKAIKDGYMEIHFRNYREHFQPMGGFVEFLDYLDSRDIKYAIATATQKHGAEDQFKRLGLMDRLQFITTEGQVGKTKEFPDVYIDAAKRMGADETNTIVCEDALYAIRTASKAGFRTVGIREEYFKEDHDDIEKIADVYVDDFNELLKLIEEGSYQI